MADIISGNRDKEEREQHGVCVHSNGAMLGKGLQTEAEEADICKALSLGCGIGGLRHQQSSLGLQVTKSNPPFSM